MSTLLSISIAMLAGLLMARLFKVWKLPNVTAYLVAGVLVGPYFLGSAGIDGLGFTSSQAVESLSLISQVALGFIAFSIGNEFRLTDLRATGRKVAVIGVLQALTATALVDGALIVFHLLLPEKLSLVQALTLGAIATATAPAATLMVVRQYKAKGPLTNLLLPIVALDDAVGLVVFAVSFGVARALVSGHADLVSILVNPLVEIAASLLLGAVLGWLLTSLEALYPSSINRLNVSIAMVFLAAALAMMKFQIGPVSIGFSSLLVCMMLGTVLCNLCPVSQSLMEGADEWTSPLFALFFVVSGAELELNVFADKAIVAIGIVYILFRSAGKYFGSWAGAKGTGCAPHVCKYLGITLLPQAGVALGMCTTAMQLGAEGALIRNITLFSVLIYELAGPLMTKWALTQAGDIQPAPAEVRRSHRPGMRRLLPLRDTH